MSGSWYEHLADTWQDSKIDGLGMFNPQELVEESMKMDSRGMESLGKKWNIQPLQDEAHGNVSDPAKGIGKASTAAGAAMAGGWLGNLFGGAPAVASAAPPMAEMGGPMAAQLASQMGLQSGQAAGLMGTMESALTDSGYTPSSLLNAAQNAPGNMPQTIMGPNGQFDVGQSFGQTMGNYGRGLLSKAQSPGFKQDAQRYAVKQGLNMMDQPQQQQAPARPFQYQQEPMRNPYGQEDPLANLTEEQKMQLRMMGYQV
jgi:hypothetical protein